MTTDGVALVTSYFQTVGTGDLQVFDRIFAPDYINHWSNKNDHGPDGMKDLIRRLRELIAELRVEVHDLIADGDKVAARITVRGTCGRHWSADGNDGDPDLSSRRRHDHRSLVGC